MKLKSYKLQSTPPIQQFEVGDGNVDLMPPSCHGKDAAELVQLFETRRVAEATRVLNALDPKVLDAEVRNEFQQLSELLDRDDDEWLRRVPGKAILKQFAAKAQLEQSRLKRMYLKVAMDIAPDPFAEVKGIFAYFSAYTSS